MSKKATEQNPAMGCGCLIVIFLIIYLINSISSCGDTPRTAEDSHRYHINSLQEMNERDVEKMNQQLRSGQSYEAKRTAEHINRRKKEIEKHNDALRKLGK